MADPFTIVSIGLGAASALFQGIQGMQAANYQAEVARNNAKIAQQNASRAIQKSQMDQQESDNAAALVLGEQIAEQGASGAAIGSPSFFRARRASKENARMDALNIRTAGELEAYDFQNQARGYLADASAARSAGTNALITGGFGVASSIIGGASQYRLAKKYGYWGAPRGLLTNGD